jgi:hypothetical protein
VAADAQGNVIVAGAFTGTLDLGAGVMSASSDYDPSIFVAKLDPAGAILWSESFGAGSSYASVDVLLVDPSGTIVLAGAFQPSIDFGTGPLTTPADSGGYLVRLDPDGHTLWSRGYPVTEPWLEAAALGPSGDLFIAGGCDPDLDLGAGPLSCGDGALYLARLDPTGNVLWSRVFPISAQTYVEAVAVDAAGDVVLAGELTGTLDLGAGPLVSEGSWDPFVARFDAAGGTLWSRRFGDAELQNVLGVACDGAGDVVLAGSFDGTIDFGTGPLSAVDGPESNAIYAAKLDPSGAALWSRAFVSAQLMSPWSLAVGPGGDIVLSGYFDGTTDFGAGPVTASDPYGDGFLTALDAAGQHRWSKDLAGNAHINTVAFDAAGHLMVTGLFHDSIDFGGAPASSDGLGWDIFIAELGP